MRTPPVYADFKPTGVPKRLLESVDLSLDEYEAVRLANYLGYDHARGAAEMGISRPTFTRLLDSAQQKLARFLVEGLHISIAGGVVHFRENLIKCGKCGKVFPAPIDKSPETCPVCGASTLENLAAAYGHGACCKA